MKPMPIGPLTPLCLPVGVVLLREMVEGQLADIEAAGNQDDALEFELAVSQRRDFLRWLDAQPGPTVQLAMYPLPELVLQDFAGTLLS